MVALLKPEEAWKICTGLATTNCDKGTLEPKLISETAVKIGQLSGLVTNILV
jgi:hypothetical protein